MRRWLFPILVGIVLGIVAWQVTLVAIPGVLMSLAIGRVGARGGVNVFSHAPLATDRARAIVRPSPDLSYSSCPFDVAAGPVLIDATPVAAPYWSLSIFDAGTNAVFVRNDAAGRRRPLRVAIALDGQAVPAGAEVVRVRQATGIALIRILVDTPQRFPAIDAARRTATCRRIG